MNDVLSLQNLCLNGVSGDPLKIFYFSCLAREFTIGHID